MSPGKSFRPGAQPLADLAGAVLDPVLRRRAGLSMALVQSWEEIAGPALADCSRPERIVWPRRMNEDDPFEPATLVVACEGAAALRIQHETGEIIGRINGFLGFEAIGRIRIVQKPVAAAPGPARARLRPLAETERRGVAEKVRAVEDEELRAALERLGCTILASRKN